MVHSVSNIIPSLRQFALQIEFTNAIVGKVWILPNDSTDSHDYEFTRDGTLYMSLNGNIQVGSWKILPTGRIIIDRISDKIMLNFDFAINGVVILQKSGGANSPFLLFDKNVVLDGDILAYLENYNKENNKIQSENLTITYDSPIFGSKEKDDAALLIFVLITIFFLGLALVSNIK